MLKNERAAAIGVDQIMNVWETMNDGHPYFAIYYNKSNKYLQWNKDDLEGARKFLQDNLVAVSEAGDSCMYYLNIYDEPKSNYPNSGMICSFPFRLNEWTERAVSGYGAPSTPSHDLIKLINDNHAKQMELQAEILRLKYENQPGDTWDRIGGLLETPGAANLIVPLLQPVIAGIMGVLQKISGLPGGPQTIPSIAGPSMTATEQETALDAALTRLEKHSDLVELLTALADFADKNPAIFKMYLQTLKEQG